MDGAGWILVLICIIFSTATLAHQPDVAVFDQDGPDGPLRWVPENGPLEWLLLNAGRSPGLKARITDNGLNYATQKAINDLSTSVIGQRIPDQEGNAGGVQYWISGMTVKGFERPDSNIAFKPDQGLDWTASRLGLKASGNWRYKYKKGWFTFRDSGTFDIEINGVSFRLGIALGMDSGGRPTISPKGCNDDVGSVSVKFHGGLSWIYNLFKGYISKGVKKAMKGQLCRILSNVVNKDGQEALSKIPVKMVIAGKFQLDYRFISSPLFTTRYMETYHKGEVTTKFSPVTPPFDAPPLANTTDTSRMFYLFISDYLFNTLAYAAQQIGLLRYYLTPADFPPGRRQIFNTSCSFTFCIGNLIPQLMQNYPNSTVHLRLGTTAAPEMLTTAKNIRVESHGNIVFDVQLPNRTLVDGVIILNASMATNVSMAVQNQKIYAKVLDMTINATVDADASRIKDVSEVAINFILENAVRIFVKPTLNKLGSKGFPLPVTAQVKFKNPKLTLARNTLIVATDITYG